MAPPAQPVAVSAASATAAVSTGRCRRDNGGSPTGSRTAPLCPMTLAGRTPGRVLASSGARDPAGRCPRRLRVAHADDLVAGIHETGHAAERALAPARV